ncbi:MAG: hypothetical protein ACLT1W_14880 [Alistipes onderdonkii]
MLRSKVTNAYVVAVAPLEGARRQSAGRLDGTAQKRLPVCAAFRQ